MLMDLISACADAAISANANNMEVIFFMISPSANVGTANS
jgi:hypothetical protein